MRRTKVGTGGGERLETKVKIPTRKTDVWGTHFISLFGVRATRRRHTLKCSKLHSFPAWLTLSSSDEKNTIDAKSVPHRPLPYLRCCCGQALCAVFR